MTSLIQRQPLVAVLAVTAAVLVAAIGIETGFGTRLGPRIPTGVSKKAVPFEAKVLPPVAATRADQAYPEMVARPLFIPTRRPAPPAEPESKATFKRGQYVLQGVIIAGDLRIAMLRENATGKVHRVEKGHEINGMKLAEVNPESVTLALGKDQEVLPLQVIKPGAPGAGAAAEGPFGPPGASHAGAAPAAPGTPSPNPNPNPNPLATPRPGTPAAPKGAPEFGPPSNPPAGTVPQATTAPLTPEELLARRRARRAQ